MNDATANLILNVDDNDGARYAKSRILSRAGFDVIEAANGTEALERARDSLPDLVLLDVKLPDINGFEVCRQIKAAPETAAILVLQTSAAAVQSIDRIRGLDGGADSYLIEPIEPAELIAHVRALLRVRRAEGALRESEERFRQMAENIDDVFWMLDPSTDQLLYVSPAYRRLWGDEATCAGPRIGPLGGSHSRRRRSRSRGGVPGARRAARRTRSSTGSYVPMARHAGSPSAPFRSAMRVTGSIGWQASSTTSPSAKPTRWCCATRIAARTSFSPCLRMNCAIRLPRSAMRLSCLIRAARLRRKTLKRCARSSDAR